MRTPLECNIIADVSALQPHGDFVLVKRIPEDEGLIAAPGRVMTDDGRWVDADSSGLRRGLVLAVGPGDPLVTLRCSACGKERTRRALMPFTHSMSIRADISTGRCSCGESRTEMVGQSRAPMGVKVGDEVFYTRVPANNIRLNEQWQFNRGEYVFLHEEQHIFAVIEREGVKDVSTMVA